MSIREHAIRSIAPRAGRRARVSPLPTAHCPPPTSLRTPHSALRTAPAFTLIELLIVLAIITVVVALGIPIFGALTGAKSTEAGRNLVAATLGGARTVAVNEGKYCGVLFSVDPATERTSMTLVIVNDPSSSLEDADPYDRYKAVVAGQRYFAGATTGGVTRRADRVIDIAVDADATFRGTTYPNATNYMNYFGNYRPVVRTYRCTEDNTASGAAMRPPHNGPYGYTGTALPQQRYTLPTPGNTGAPAAESSMGPFATRYWDGTPERSIERYSGEQQLLPKGVGVQVIVEQLATDTKTAPGTPADRYLGVGIIMFDPQGRVVNKPYTIDPKSTLGQSMGLAAATATAPAPTIPAGVGLVLFDLGTFRDQGFTLGDYTINSTTSNYLDLKFDPATTNVVATAMNTLMARPIGAAFNTNAPDAKDEYVEEQWLDNNTTPLLVNRFSGALAPTE